MAIVDNEAHVDATAKFRCLAAPRTMTVLRWLLGVLAVLSAAGAVLSFALYVSLGVDVWLQRARACRGWLYAALLFWFNLEIWRRVLMTLLHWGS